MRVVVDTNIFISALIYRGRPDLLLKKMTLPSCTLITSEAILQELQTVLQRKFGWNSDRAAVALPTIRAVPEIVIPQRTVSDCDDPDDNRILEAALEGSADIVVSSDKHLLRMKAFRGI